MTSVTIAAGRYLTIVISGFIYMAKGGDVLSIPTNEVAYLRRDGVIV